MNQPRDHAATPPADSAPTYYECPLCGYLSSDIAFGGGTKACPKCGAPGDSRRTYPTDRLRKLDERIRRYHAEGESEIVVILVAAFLEAILEDILDRIMQAHGADLQIRRVVLDCQRSIGGRIGHVFPGLTNTEFEGIASELGFREFPHSWRMLREARNSFIHDSPFSTVRESIDQGMGDRAINLLDQAYRLFVRINNRFVANGIGKRPDAKSRRNGRR